MSDIYRHFIWFWRDTLIESVKCFNEIGLQEVICFFDILQKSLNFSL